MKLLQRLYDWFTWKSTFDRMELEARVGYQRGYQWAMTELLSGRKTCREVSNLADGAIDYTDFDRGANMAVVEYSNKHQLPT